MILTIIVIVICIFIFLVNFVVDNIEMFETSFDIVFGFPLVTAWSYTFEGIQFVYIIGGSILAGAMVIAVGTWVLNTKRKMKMLSLRKELKRLEKAVLDVKSTLPSQQAAPVENVSVQDDGGGDSAPDSSAATPEDITRSFEDTVQQEDVLEENETAAEESDMIEADGEEIRETEENTKTKVLAISPEQNAELSQDMPVEAELVASEDDGQVDEESEQEDSPRKKNENEDEYVR